MKNKIYLLFYQCIFILISFFNKLFVSEAKAEVPLNFIPEPYAGALTPVASFSIIVKSALGIIVPIGLLVVLVIFLKKKFGKKVAKKKKK